MKLSEFIAKLVAEFEANGDAENVSLGITVPDEDGRAFRHDVVLNEENSEILRDCNYVNGMACIVADSASLNVQMGGKCMNAPARKLPMDRQVVETNIGEAFVQNGLWFKWWGTFSSRTAIKSPF